MTSNTSNSKKLKEKRLDIWILITGILCIIIILIFFGMYIQDIIKYKNNQVCTHERSWFNITLYQECYTGYVYGVNYCTDNYYAYFSSEFYGVGCDKDVQLLKVGDEFTAISNHSDSKCFVENITNICN